MCQSAGQKLAAKRQVAPATGAGDGQNRTVQIVRVIRTSARKGSFSRQRQSGPSSGQHSRSTRTSGSTAADGLDYDYSLRSQPNNIEIYFDLASRALKQMMP